MLMIRQVFLVIDIFEVDGAVRSLETLAKLRHVKHVVHVRKVGWKLELIGEIASLADDLERTHVSRGKLPFDTEATSAFHWRDAEVDMVSDLESHITVLTIIVTLWTRLRGFEVITYDFAHLFCLCDQVIAKKLTFTSL